MVNLSRIRRIIPSLLATTAVVVGGSAFTALPAAAQSVKPPSYATSVPSYASGEERLDGRVTSYDGKYGLQVRDERGYLDNIRLHNGTVINPTGLRLSPGQTVTVLGHNSGATFDANEIDTPYADYGAGYAHGYPAYGYYPYGYYGYPAFGLGLRERGFGFGGWF
jgi:hypothetical protein